MGSPGAANGRRREHRHRGPHSGRSAGDRQARRRRERRRWAGATWRHVATARRRTGAGERRNDDGREAAHNEGPFVAALNYHYNRCPRPRVTEPLL
jgi:hypothetical protein